MGNLSDHVDITISADSLAVARQGFGLIAILSHTADFSERRRLYNRLSDVANDFDSDTPEYLAAASAFGQNPRPTQIMIARMAGEVTQGYQCQVLVAEVGKVYKVTMAGPGFATSVLTYTGQEGDDASDISAGLVSQINGVANKTFTATQSTDSFTIVADDVGSWFSVAVDPVYVSAYQNHAAPSDPSVADDLTAINLEDDSFYWVYPLYNSADYAKAVCDWVQDETKFALIQVDDTRDLGDLGEPESPVGVADTLNQQEYTRSATDWHYDNAEMAGAALLGTLAPRDPGSWTAKFKKRTGVPVVPLTGTQRANLIARHANFYESVAGIGITSEGTTCKGPSDPIYGFIDNIVSLDATSDDVGARIFGALAGTDKLPRDSEGLVVIESQLKAAMDFAVQRRIAAPDPAPVVSIPPIADQTDLLPRGIRGTCEFTLAGAVHHASITIGVLI